MTSNLKVKVKQFQWFQMQTKVRQIIQQILGPIQKRILQTSSILNKVKTNQAQDEKKIQQMMLMIANDPKVFQTGVFATVDQKFVQNQKMTLQLARQIQQQNRYVQNKFKILDLRMQQSSQVLKNVASLKQRVSKQMQIQNDNIMVLRSNFQKLIFGVNEDIKDARRSINDNMQTNQKRNCTIEQQIRRIKQQILQFDDNLNLQRQMHHQKTVQLQNHQKLFQKHKQEIKDLFDNKYLTKRLGDLVQDMENQIKKVLFKVDAIQPLITHAQITDCLTAILPPKIKNKISIYSYKKYFALNKQVLQKDYRKVVDKFKSLQLLQTMQKKCTREIVQLKRKKLLQMGIDIDHLTFQQRQKYYAEVSLDDQLNIDYQQAKVTQKVDEEQVRRVCEKFMLDYIKNFKQQVRVQMQDNKKFVYGLQEQMRFQISKFQGSVNKVKNQCSSFHTQHLLQIKLVANNSNDIQQQIKGLKDKYRQVTDLQRLFYNFCSLLNHLSIQDEIDKQNISLMGTKQVNSEDMTEGIRKNMTVALEGKCFSCNGYPATTLSAFKMACLAYNPSAIRIDSKEYKRQELLEFTTNMLQNIKKVIQNVPLNDRRLQTQVLQPNIKIQDPVNFQTFEDQQYLPKPNMRFFNSHLKIPSRHNTEEDIQARRKSTPNTSNTKFRKAKKTLNTTFSSSYYKSNKPSIRQSLNQNMVNTSIIFNSLRKQNQSYL